MVKKVVVIVEKKDQSPTSGEYCFRRRTAVFDESVTLKEVLSWARQDINLIENWDSAAVTILEDEITNPSQSVKKIAELSEGWRLRSNEDSLLG